MSTRTRSMQSLPLELVETILLYSAIGGFPTAIASLAQTCRSFRKLIYDPADHHMWRDIFFATFDDPRDSQFFDNAGFDWGADFRRIIWAERFIKRHTQPLRVQKVYNLRSRTAATSVVDLSPTYSTEDSVRALQTLISVIKTCAPRPSAPAVMVRDRQGNRIPPGSLLHGPSLNYAYWNTPEITAHVAASASANIPWLQTVLRRGLPPALVVKVAGESRDREWDVTPEALAIGELICCTGFIPVRELLEERIGRLSSSSASNSGPPSSSRGISSLDMSLESQQKRARYRAREVVYNIRYLERRRNWGPYLPISDDGAVEKTPSKRLHRLYTDNSDSDSEDDTDWLPGNTDESTSISSAVTSDGTKPKSGPSTPHSDRPEPPTPDRLYPDWTWLAGARIIMQANLQGEGFTRIQQYLRWDTLRESWTVLKHGETKTQNHAAPETADSRGNQLDTQSDGVAAPWDWAGAEGIWRRAVSWFGFSDLVNFNTTESSARDSIQENTLIVPVRLRVVGYGPPAVPEYPDRPTILIEGETGGADWEGHDGDDDDDIRRIHGTVSMIADGNVRWAMYTSHEDDPTRDQWILEGVQIGVIGSEIGMLGTWTGAGHDRMDAIGPFWQWRVA
ncbi:uncharacterized protein LAESUDRAFT_751817 [Laetiporus sulphureus 93-53]|uniref:F-box domain-containing protein n=1 Tax=Laetiporus sulphureus 93-53 TaxID=1314785 RepID=A0A165CLY4_9APHY|nr:uncharacterized protein LAESUDRAFT_751817 [Laetiporus sulphureus 93-53]KZT03047.1 hypothetical protein LAESUDRAFT_751817 [Laetiporus sulphureus 93-53]